MTREDHISVVCGNFLYVEKAAYEDRGEGGSNQREQNEG